MPIRPQDPLRAAPPPRIPLPRAPLVRTLAQVRFSKIVKISDETHIGDFQESLRQHYPHFKKDVAKALEFKFDGGEVSASSTDEVIWRLFDAQRNWRISLTPVSITLEVTRYSSREDFLKRLDEVLTAVADHLRPALATRVGFRYVNRLEKASEIEQLGSFIHPEIAGIYTGPLEGQFSQTFSQVQGSTAEGQLLARWGLTPPGTSHDPDTSPPSAQLSWLLDIDSYKENTPIEEGFTPSQLVEFVNLLANRAYAFFRWSVTDEFLTNFGGDIV